MSRHLYRHSSVRVSPAHHYAYWTPEHDTGKVVRDPILIAGFYWYDAPPAQAPGFQAWLRQNAALVKVRKTTTSVDTSVFSGPNAHVWALFEVLFPVLWLDAAKFGFPETATKDTGPDVVSSGAEPQKDPLDKIADGVKDVIPFLAPVSTGVLITGGLVGLAYIFRKELFDNAKRRFRHNRPSSSR